MCHLPPEAQTRFPRSGQVSKQDPVSSLGHSKVGTGPHGSRRSSFQSDGANRTVQLHGYRHNKKVRICLDQPDFNKALLREHYPVPKLEDSAPSLSGAQYFSTLDADTGFWQIKLGEERTAICTMSTPFGR